MDDAVGIVLEELKKQGIDKETIVVFTSDNGGVASGDSFSTSNLPLREVKDINGKEEYENLIL